MLRKTLKSTTKHKKLQAFIEKSRVPKAYLSPSRRMISKGVGIGLFIAFIPMPMQMALVLAMMPFTKFNVPIALAMCWLSNPFTMPPMYYVEYLTGSFLLGMQAEPVELTLEWFQKNIDAIFIPLYFGTAVFSIFGSITAYWAVNHFWRSSVHKDRKKHRHER